MISKDFVLVQRAMKVSIIYQLQNKQTDVKQQGRKRP
jgi:hypothetical protein